MAQLVTPLVPTGTLPRSRFRRLRGEQETVPTSDATSLEAGSEREERVTLAHVRTLETALEEQVRRVAQLTEELAAERARPRDDVRQVAATVEGLRVAFGRDPLAQRLLARVDAALDRLVAPDVIVRTPVTTAPDRGDRSRPDATRELPAVTETPGAPAAATATTGSDTATVPDGAAGDSAETAVRVAPVPPLEEPDTGRRTRRGRRR